MDNKKPEEISRQITPFQAFKDFDKIWLACMNTPEYDPVKNKMFTKEERFKPAADLVKSIVETYGPSESQRAFEKMYPEDAGNRLRVMGLKTMMNQEHSEVFEKVQHNIEMEQRQAAAREVINKVVDAAAAKTSHAPDAKQKNEEAKTMFQSLREKLGFDKQNLNLLKQDLVKIQESVTGFFEKIGLREKIIDLPEPEKA